MSALSSQAALKAFASEFLNGKDINAIRAAMSENYVLRIGQHVLRGREQDYLPGTLGQFEQFDDFCIHIHQVILGEGFGALRFSESGCSKKHGGAKAVWHGIALFDIHAGQLQKGWAEEDYLARRYQLSGARPQSLLPALESPWILKPESGQPNPQAERVAEGWLSEGGWLMSEHAFMLVEPSQNPPLTQLFNPIGLTLDRLASAGDWVVFHCSARGTYLGGFNEISASAVGRAVDLAVAGCLQVRGDTVVRAYCVADRLGMNKALAKQ